MPIVKANEPLGPRPVIITIYGDPGIGKTSLINTAKAPITIDGDRGISRSIFRKDALVIDKWEEVQDMEKQGTLKPYATIGIDTPKAILDDYMMSYVVRQDPKLRNNKLWAYGAIGDEFKIFLNNRRQDQADLVNICHAKKDEDSKRMVPDVTGQSYQLILRVSDMIGYYTIINGRRMLSFDPTESTVGKNVACLPPIEVPDKTDPAFRSFLADVIEKVRAAIASQSEEQLEAMQKSATYQEAIQTAATLEELEQIKEELGDLPDYLKVPLNKLIDEKAVTFFTKDINAVATPEDLTAMLEAVNTLSDGLKIPLKRAIVDRAKQLGFTANKETRKFEGPVGAAADVKATAAGVAPSTPALPAATPEIPDTPFDDRVQVLAGLGMTQEVDQVSGFGLAFPYEEIGDWPESDYLDAVTRVNEAKKAPKPRTSTRRNTATAR